VSQVESGTQKPALTSAQPLASVSALKRLHAASFYGQFRVPSIAMTKMRALSLFALFIFFTCLASDGLALVVPSKTGDLHVAIGFGQHQAEPLSDGTKFKTAEQGQIALFGRMTDGDLFGLDFEVGARPFSAEFTEGVSGRFNTTFLRTALLGRFNLVSTADFEISVFAGGGAAWHVERRCSGATPQDPCPLEEKAPNILPSFQAGAEFRFADAYGLRISAEYLAIPMWTSVIGPSASVSASFFWNLTHDM
jgi:hypothetical protein